MKNNKGLSLMTLVITIIVIIIISSISIYNGINLVDETRKKEAEDKLKTICSTILKDDSFLEFNEENIAELTIDDFDYMDLLKYYDEDYSLTVKKDETGDIKQKTIIYQLIMQEKDSTNKYEYSIDYIVSLEKNNYNIDFDEVNGVNRPIIIDGMTALTEEGEPVEDIYIDNWYNYKKAVSNFARMQTDDGKIYVWIPRFAYGIQSFYDGREAKNVPSTAISIVFLKENSNYMINGEVLPENYNVHPAFTNDGVEYSGIWIEESVSDTSSRYSLINITEENAHLMTSKECGAAIYLMYGLGDLNEIVFSDDEYVNSYTRGDVNRDGVITSSDVSAITGGNDITDFEEIADVNMDGVVNSLDSNLLNNYIDGTEDIYRNILTPGEALTETPWDRVLDDKPTKDKTIVIRKFSSGLFDFKYSNGSDIAKYRKVIRIK